MSGKVPGLVLLAMGVVALLAGFQLPAFVVIGIGLLLVARGGGSGRRHARRGAAVNGSTGFDSRGFDNGTTYYSDSSASGNDPRDSNDQCDASDDGGGAGDSGGDCGSDSGGGDGDGGGGGD
ncbi:MAG: hypothetical protein HOP03_12875 [Lysobacter sp.]|nr:hypothetical protein [Lysobacter sp.]